MRGKEQRSATRAALAGLLLADISADAPAAPLDDRFRLQTAADARDRLGDAPRAHDAGGRSPLGQESGHQVAEDLVTEVVRQQHSRAGVRA